MIIESKLYLQAVTPTNRSEGKVNFLFSRVDRLYLMIGRVGLVSVGGRTNT